ncbi:DMT family transporter [Actinoallomurus rhizosphaericola]|uniref:DMT family transporter n=1 Tax=Actinoallomurus rhizosphaericola TaxID=2952536 RepID=UPI00209344DB|nr:DMT family transporter [Actinoallomurus rhizosphaericola]MCO5996429.1 DMT family transporter [Actinoallomurus rhizosphaericola]
MGSAVGRRSGVPPLLLASAIWGCWSTGEKYALRGLPVMTMLGVTLAAATALLWAVLLAKGHRRPAGRRLGALALLGLLEPMIGYGAIGLGLTSIEAAQAALLSGTESCFVVVLAAIAARRLPTGRGVAGVVLATAGVAALGGAHPEARLTAGDLLVLLGSLSAAGYSVLADRVVANVEPLVVTTYQFTFGLVFTLPLMLWQWAWGAGIAAPAARPRHWLVAAVVCGGGLAVAFLLYNHAITRITVAVAGVILNVIPLFGLATAVLALGEGVDRWRFLGAALILGGIFLFSERDAEPSAPEVARGDDVPSPR